MKMTPTTLINNLRHRVSNGDVSAACELARILALRSDAIKYRKECLILLKFAAKKGNTDAIYALGNWHEYGIGMKKNMRMANRLFRIAAMKGHASAQYDLAVSLELGKSVKKDVVQAVKWYRRSAEQGDVDAQVELGRCYYQGIGVKRNNFRVAFRLFQKAAKDGASAGQYWFGVTLEEGRGTRKDPRSAVKWYRRAAEQQDSDAAYELGRCYYFGIGLKQDIKQAHDWLTKAAKGNHPAARKWLRDEFSGKRIGSRLGR